MDEISPLKERIVFFFFRHRRQRAVAGANQGFRW